jgi:hypothetical protein
MINYLQYVENGFAIKKILLLELKKSKLILYLVRSGVNNF